MPVRPHDARYVIATDYLITNPTHDLVGLILREDEGIYAMMGEKFRWGQTAVQAMEQGWFEEAGIARWDDPASGVLACRLVGIFGLMNRPERDPRFLQSLDPAQCHQVISCTWLCEIDVNRFTLIPGSSVMGFSWFSVDALPVPLFLDHEEIIHAVLRAEQLELPFPLLTYDGIYEQI